MFKATIKQRESKTFCLKVYTIILNLWTYKYEWCLTSMATIKLLVLWLFLLVKKKYSHILGEMSLKNIKIFMIFATCSAENWSKFDFKFKFSSDFVGVPSVLCFAGFSKVCSKKNYKKVDILIFSFVFIYEFYNIVYLFYFYKLCFL